jgi:cysteine-rich repeat protein
VNLKSGRYTPICGDGLLKGIETQPGRCDDGNTITNDGCSSTCFVETGYTCTSNPSACTPICGDGKVVGIEATADHCDDGNT